MTKLHSNRDEEIQAVVDSLVAEGGKNVRTRKDYAELLSLQGIKQEMVTEEVFQLALEHARMRRESELTFKGPFLCENGISRIPYQEWRSECGRYRIVRKDGEDSHFLAMAKISAPSAKERILCGNKKTLLSCLEEVEKYHKEVHLLKKVESNKKTLVKEAHRVSLDKSSHEEVPKKRNRTLEDPNAPRDKWGSVVGSDAARANAVLTLEPKRMHKIMEEGGLSDTVYNHFKEMVKQGKVKKTNKGYILANPDDLP